MATQDDAALIAAWRGEEEQPFSGWDFSYLRGRYEEEQPPWSYADLARECLRASHAVLDMGTGGGERLLEMRDAWPERVAVTEGYPPNVALARERLGPLGVAVVESRDGLEMPVPYADEAFDLVLNRHTSYNAREVERVLRPGGAFLTQQVDGLSLADLTAALGGSPPWPFANLGFFLERVASTSLVVDEAREWTGLTTFTDVGAIVHFVRAIPWLAPAGFSVATHTDRLLRLQRRLEAEGRLTFETKRFLLRAHKPGP